MILKECGRTQPVGDELGQCTDGAITNTVVDDYHRKFWCFKTKTTIKRVLLASKFIKC